MHASQKVRVIFLQPFSDLGAQIICYFQQIINFGFRGGSCDIICNIDTLFPESIQLGN